MSNIKIILSLVFSAFSLGGFLYMYQDNLYPLFDSFSATVGINNGINNQETTVSNSTPKSPRVGLTGFYPRGKVFSTETTSVQTDIARKNISDSPLLALLWKQHQKSQITVRNGDFIIYDKEKLRLAKESVTSKKIADHTIQDEDIARNVITSRAIDDGTIIGEDVNQNADLTIRSLVTTGALTIGGTTSFGGDFNMQNNLILNIGNAGTDFTGTGGLNLAGSIDVNGTFNDIAGTLNLSGNTLTSSGSLGVAPNAGNNFNLALSGAGDFTVNTNQFYVDTSTGNIGIGTATPATLLDIYGTTTFRGNVLFGTDNLYDIGASGVSRPRSLYVGTSVYAPVFIGSLTGNADTATILQNTRTINGVAFDGSGNISVPSHAGIDSFNAITSNGDGTASVPANTATFLNDSGTAFTERIIVANTALTLTNNSANFVVADRDTGAWAVLSSVDSIDYLRYLPYAEIYRSGNNLHVQVSPLYGYAESSNVFQRISKTERYARESGLDAISVDGGLNITANGGIVWAAMTPFTIDAVSPATTWFDAHHVTSSWVNTYHATTPVINNTQYDNGTDLVPLTDTYWTINYIYRGIEASEQNHLYRVLGNAEYSSLELAKASNTISSLPEIISSHAMLIGRIIVQKNATASYAIESSFSTVFAGSSAVTSHASLIGLLDDDHTQYALLAGRLGGQTLIGGTAVTDVLKLQSTTGIGTLTSPAIQALVGTNGGTTALTILNNGNVGIGTATPTSLFSVGATSQFQVNSTGAIAAATGITSSGTIIFSGLSTAGIVTNTAGGVLGTVASIPVANGGTNAITIGSAGSISYSTGTAYAFSAVGTAGQALISGGSGAPTFFAPTLGSVLFATTSGALAQDNANFFWDNTNNRLGIGTASPGAPLDVVAIDATLSVKATGAGAYSGINMFNNSGTLSASFQYGNAFAGIFPNTMFLGTRIANAPLVFVTGAGTNERMRIDSSGNVGIGTTTPTANLQVTQGTVGAGTVSNGVGGTTVTGVSTQFINTFRVGDSITINGETKAISAIASNTSMTTAAFTGANSGIAYTLAGGTRFSVLGNGNVGIGTANPSYQLDLAGNAVINGSSQLNFRVNGANLFVGLSTQTQFNSYNLSAPLIFSLNQGVTEVARFAGTTGNFGIGTTNPGAALDVYGGDIWQTTSNSSYYLKINTNVSASDSINFTGPFGATFFQYDENVGAVSAKITTLGVSGGRVNINGNVGIGTTNPTTALEVHANSVVSGLGALYLGDGTNTSNAFSVNGRAMFGLDATRSSVVVQGLLGKGIDFNVNNSTFGSGQAMVILSNGNVGIGTTGPNSPLQIYNSIASTRFIKVGNVANPATTAGSGGIVVDINGGGGIYMSDSTAGIYGKYEVYSGVLGVGTMSNHPVVFSTNNAEAMRILGNGNVGIGTTSPVHFLDITKTGENQRTVYGANVSMTASTLQSDATATGNDETLTNQYYAWPFTASASHTVGSWAVRLKKVGTVTNTVDYIRVKIYSDNAGVPNTLLLTTDNIKMGSLTTSYVSYLFGGDLTLVNGTTYWIAVERIASVTGGGSIAVDRNGTALTTATVSVPASGDWTVNAGLGRYIIYGQSPRAIYGNSTNSYGVYGNSTNSIGVNGFSTNSNGVQGNSTNGTGVYGNSTNNFGVQGNSTNSYGVQGNSTNSYGVNGTSTNGYGVYGGSTNGFGVQGSSTNSYGGVFYQSGTLTIANSANTMLIRRFGVTNSTGSLNYSGNVLQITDNPTGTGTVTGALISGSIDGTTRLNFNPRVADGASAVAYMIDTKDVLANATAQLLTIRNGGADKFTILASGNVGIGTTSPSALLSLVQTNHTAGLSVNGYDTQSGKYIQLFVDSVGFSNINSSSGFRFQQAAGNIAFISTTNTEGFRLYDDIPLSFGVTLATRYLMGRDTTSGNFRLAYGGAISDTSKIKFTVDNTGNVGIGTTSPASLLSVGATSQFQVNSTGAITAATGITSSGTITFSGFSSNGGPLYTNASGVLAQTTAGTATQILHGGTTPSFGAVSLTADISGTLPVLNGGTNATTIGSAGSLAYSTGTAYAFSAVGTAGQALVSGGTGAPTFFAPTLGSVLFATTSGALAQDNANFFWDDTNNRLGLGDATPDNQFDLLSSSAAHTGMIIGNVNAGNYNPIIQLELTENVPLFTLGIDDSDSDKFKIATGSDITGTNQFTIDSTGTTYIANLNLGAQSFETNAGAVTWVDMPVTSSATAGTIERYTAQLDGNPMLTVYSESDGAGSIQNSGVSIGNATLQSGAKFAVTQTMTSTTAGTLYGTYNSVSDTGVTTGTDTSYGSYSSLTRTGATGGTINSYGNYTLLTTDNAGTGTSTAYGSYIDTGTAGATNADTVYGLYINTESNAGTAYGLYVDAGTGAGTEFSGIFMNGNVGIGTANPGALLDVNGKTIIGNGNKSIGGWPLYISDSSNMGWKVTDSSGTSKFELYVGSGGINQMRLLGGETIAGYNQDLTLGTDNNINSVTIQRTSGNVGIGTTNPGGLLDIAQEGNTKPVIIRNTTVSGGEVQASPQLLLKGYLWNSAQGAKVMSGGLQLNSYTNNANPSVSKLSFLVGAEGATPTEQMYVTSSGLFSILGGADFAGPSLSDTYNVKIRNTTAAGIGTPQNSNKLIFEGRAWNGVQGDVANQAYIQLLNSTQNVNPFTERLGFFTQAGSNSGASTETMSILNTGNVGIGTTVPDDLLHIVGSSAGNVTMKVQNTNGGIGANSELLLTTSVSLTSTTVGASLMADRTNVGGAGSADLVFRNSLATTMTERMRIMASGNVGIGTTAPTAMLQVGTATAGGNVKIDNGYICVDTDGTCTGATTAGTVYAVNAYTTGADYAEYFYTKDTDLKPGEAVCIDSETENGVKRCQNNGDNNIMGIVSSHPSIVGNKNHANDEHYKIIGMLGQVAGKVSNENGNIRVGDSLTAGLVPGETRKANAGESTVGVALENSSDTTATIQILISRRNQSLTVEKVEQAVTDNITAMNIGDQVNALVSNAKVALDTQIANQSNILTVQTQNIADIKNDIIALQSENTIEKNKTELLQSQMDLIKAQNQSVIDFMLTLDMNSLVYKDILGNLDIGTGTFTAKDIEALGTIKAKDITTDTLTMKENRTSGKGVILAGQTETTIDTPDVSENAKISLTAKGSSNGKILYFDEIEDGKSFKVKIDAPTVEKDINFVWLIIK